MASNEDRRENVQPKIPCDTTTNSGTATSPKTQTTNPSSNSDTLNQIVQYIIVRADLKWNSGAMVAQACHASVASIVSTMAHEPTIEYLRDLKNMHKIVLKADSLDQLESYQKKLQESSISHHLWIEKPEEIATCLAVSPQPRHLLREMFKHLKLLK